MKVVKFLEDQEVGGKLRVKGEIKQVRDNFPEDGVEIIRRDYVNQEVEKVKKLKEKKKKEKEKKVK